MVSSNSPFLFRLCINQKQLRNPVWGQQQRCRDPVGRSEADLILLQPTKTTMRVELHSLFLHKIYNTAFKLIVLQVLVIMIVIIDFPQNIVWKINFLKSRIKSIACISENCRITKCCILCTSDSNHRGIKITYFTARNILLLYLLNLFLYSLCLKSKLNLERNL